MRIILIQTTIFGISGVLSSMLNAHQHFALPALAPLALDIGYMAGLYLFVPELGIIGLAWGTVIGGVLHIAIQLPALIKYRIGYRPAFNWQLGGVGEIVRLMGPRIVTLGCYSICRSVHHSPDLWPTRGQHLRLFLRLCPHAAPRNVVWHGHCFGHLPHAGRVV